MQKTETNEQPQTDRVDVILDQWRRERPDLELAAMGTIGRIKRSAAFAQRNLGEVFSVYNLTLWEFDVLATLRRSGKPCRMSPTELFSMLMITSGTMTHRMNRLETRGLIERLANPADSRSRLVQLTKKGFDLINEAVSAHVDNIEALLAPLGSDDRDELDRLLRKVLSILEPPAPDLTEKE
ncbi:MarR family winged helix-turn-helix transcriptional regulator [Pontiella agarivorans]|uniref:MarR family transcriptional regulator n=1 Tax=Pontiella agarivorans TaxID=3038953 RepID=A0ABU5MZA9_9BACT|nr:MarR family transcriptional regulator [Pontiella agarivorans]MDZ8119494.1 MarR family transcriptional regulator [Pontiella agarivorans]